MKFNKNKLTHGALEIVKALKKNDIKEVFVYPGGTIAAILDLLEKNNIRIFCSRHEQGAGYAALAASKIKNKPQVTIVSSGPGVTNVITPIADAFYDSVPMVVFTGQVGQKDMKGNKKMRQKGFQETDTMSLFHSITKKCFQPKNSYQLLDILDKAFILASEGRPGPVLIDLPMNIQRDNFLMKKRKKIASVKRINKKPPRNKIKEIVKLLKKSKKPLILCGNGVILSKSEKLVRKLAISHKIPVTMSLLGLGAFPTDNYLSLGFHGFTGNLAAGFAIQNCDLLLVIGSRLDLRQVGTKANDFAKKSKIIRIDIDKNEIINSRVKCDINVNFDLNTVIKEILRKLPKKYSSSTEWINQTEYLKKKYKLNYKKIKSLKPQEIIETINKYTKKKRYNLCFRSRAASTMDS